MARLIAPPATPELVRPSASAPPGPRTDMRHTLAVKQAWAHRHTPGFSGIFGRWKRKYLEIDYAQVGACTWPGPCLLLPTPPPPLPMHKRH